MSVEDVDVVAAAKSFDTECAVGMIGTEDPLRRESIEKDNFFPLVMMLLPR